MTRIEISRRSLTTLPNVLTYIRMAIIPLLVVILTPPVPESSLNLAALLFLLASLTDYLDGILARRHNMVTSIGKLLDPLADKLLTCAVLIMLLPLGKVESWIVFLIVGREIAITGLRSIAASVGFIIQASRLGKNKMVSQTIALSLLLLCVPPYQTILDFLGTAFLYISLVLGYWSALDYFVNFYRAANNQKKKEE